MNDGERTGSAWAPTCWDAGCWYPWDAKNVDRAWLRGFAGMRVVCRRRGTRRRVGVVLTWRDSWRCALRAGFCATVHSCELAEAVYSKSS